jgi:hypothetical protein
MWWPAVVKSEWEQFSLRLDYGRSPHACVNQRRQIQLELLMMSGVPLETCWAFNERWNNKSITRLHLVGYFSWVILRCTDPRISNFTFTFTFTFNIFTLFFKERNGNFSWLLQCGLYFILKWNKIITKYFNRTKHVVTNLFYVALNVLIYWAVMM